MVHITIIQLHMYSVTEFFQQVVQGESHASLLKQ